MSATRLGIRHAYRLSGFGDVDDAAREIVSKHDILTLERCDLAGAHAHDSYQIDDRCETWRHGLIERLKFFRRHIAIGHVRARLADFNQYGRFREQRGAVQSKGVSTA